MDLAWLRRLAPAYVVGMDDELKDAIQTVLDVFDFENLGRGTSILDRAHMMCGNTAKGFDMRQRLLPALCVLRQTIRLVEGS